MPKSFKGNRPPPINAEQAAALESSIRQLLANGKSKTALEKARELHKANPAPATEALLLDAYAARIQSLIQQNLVVEAKSLIEIVRQRFPTSSHRLEALKIHAVAHGGALDELVKPLNDPDLHPDVRAALDVALQNEVHDLAALASCEALPPEHSLRLAAAALQKAFAAVTIGTVAEADLALPEVSHRSPLAPWKFLVKAIDSFYRGDDEACRKYLSAIKPSSVPARLIPPLRAMLEGHPPDELPFDSRALIDMVVADMRPLRNILEDLDIVLREDEDPEARNAIRKVIQKCSASAPGLLNRLKRHILARGIVGGLSKQSLVSAMGEAPANDANFERLLARSLEMSEDPADISQACAAWERFRDAGIVEGWFPADGPEAATLLLHIARLLESLPSGRTHGGKHSSGDSNLKNRESLYERACTMDPHPDAFSQWLGFAKTTSPERAREVAEIWSKARPEDLDPVLFLMDAAVKKGLFPSALKHLAKAEQIDAIHTKVRQARLSLMVGSALRHIQRNKPHLALERVEELAALPQSKQGDRPALLAALRYLARSAQGDHAQAEAAREEMARILGSRLAGELLAFGMAESAKQMNLARIRPLAELNEAERAALPAALSRCMRLGIDVEAFTMCLPVNHLVECATQISRDAAALDIGQLRCLAEAGVGSKIHELAYSASAAGLARGGQTEVRFLLMRALALPDMQYQRRSACIAAALELARGQRDMGLVGEAVQALHRFAEADLPVTAKQAAAVLATEKAHPNFDDIGPEYDDIFYEPDGLGEEACQCPGCRAERGETTGSEFSEMNAMFDGMLDKLVIPKGMPPEFAKALLVARTISEQSGIPVEELMERAMQELPASMNAGLPPWLDNKRKKGKRK